MARKIRKQRLTFQYELVVFSLLPIILLLLFIYPSKALAQSIELTPGTALINNATPGSAAKIAIDLENRLDKDYTFIIYAENPQNTAEGYERFSDLSWINLDKEKIKLPVGESETIIATVSIPDDTKLVGKKFHTVIKFVSYDPKMIINCDLMMSVGPPPDIFNRKTVRNIIFTLLVIAIIMIWYIYREKKRNEWPTGLKIWHWIK